MKLCVAALLLLLLAEARAVILYRTGDPEENITAPTGDLLNSGWQYEGLWGDFTGTPIAPYYFISAAHLGPRGNFVFKGVTYTVVAQVYDPASDLQILRVAEVLPSFAPLYTGSAEQGQRIALFGRGRRRGGELRIDDVLKGWAWGASDGLLRWGENIVSGIYPYGAGNELLFANFDADGLPNECHLAEGDSGGAAFINDNGVWKLAGINFAVDGPFYNNTSEINGFNAAFFDARGYYASENGSRVLITGGNPIPTALYPTRISTRLPWIASVIAAPVLAREGSFVAFSYTRLVAPDTELSYTLEQSSDLSTWSAASIADETVTPNASVQTVKALVEGNANAPLFLRLRITRP